MRELENVISSAAITTSGDFIDLADLPENLQHPGQRTPEGAEWRPLSLDEVRKVHIQRVLAMCTGNRLRAAQVLGMGRTSLYRYRYLKRDQVEQGLQAKLRGAAAAGSVRIEFRTAAKLSDEFLFLEAFLFQESLHTASRVRTSISL